MIELTAKIISADSSITAGTFPAPTPNAGFPLEYADLTIPGPPVANIVSADCIKRFVNSNDGTSIQAIISFGAPALIAASRTILDASIVDSFARGWGLIIIPFLVFKASKVLRERRERNGQLELDIPEAKVVTDENGNPLELECLDELIAECLNDFWNFYGGINSKSANNGLNVTNDELTIRDENGNIIDVNTFASENPELLENVKSMISNTVMAWAEQTIADMENNGENE